MRTRLPTLWELLERNGLTGPRTLALRHTPTEPRLRRSFVDLIERRPDLFNAYQSYQERRADAMLAQAARVIAFHGDAPGLATFIGVYEVGGRRVLDLETYWSDPLNAQLRDLGMVGPDFFADKAAFYDLGLTPLLADLKGRLVIRWPGREVTWTQWVDEREDRFHVEAVDAVSRFARAPPPWRDIDLSWADLALMSPACRSDCRIGGASTSSTTSDGGPATWGRPLGGRTCLGDGVNTSGRGTAGTRDCADRNPQTCASPSSSGPLPISRSKTWSRWRPPGRCACTLGSRTG